MVKESAALPSPDPWADFPDAASLTVLTVIGAVSGSSPWKLDLCAAWRALTEDPLPDRITSDDLLRKANEFQAAQRRRRDESNRAIWLMEQMLNGHHAQDFNVMQLVANRHRANERAERDRVESAERENRSATPSHWMAL